jgi:hypothetical protein
MTPTSRFRGHCHATCYPIETDVAGLSPTCSGIADCSRVSRIVPTFARVASVDVVYEFPADVRGVVM